LVELLVALAILAVVAAIIVPRYLGIRTSAQLTVVDKNLSEISNATSEWLALGGQPPTSPDQYVAFKTIQFLSTPSNGTDVQRGLGPGPGVIDATYPTDSLGEEGSYTISLNAVVNAATSGGPNTGPGVNLTQASQMEGFYTNQVGANPQSSQKGVITQNGALVSSDSKLYEKEGPLVYPVDYDLATAIFIRTGVAVGENPVTPGVLP
jgi:type II secretory pathway pseudopilin PulG